MTNPNKLRFHAWQNREVVLALHGWQAHAGLAFVEDLNGQRLVFRFMPLTSSGAVGGWRPPSLPEVFPTKIEEIRLVLPPCRANETEAEWLRKESVTKKLPKNIHPFQFSGDLSAQAWELARLHYDPEILTPKSEDDGPMTIRLEESKKEMRSEFEARTQEITALIELLENGHSIVGFARYYAHLASGDHAACRFLLNKERLRLPYDFTHGCLMWTLDDARRRPRIRNPILRASWVKPNKWGFHQMAAERKELLNWLGLPVASPYTPSPEMSILLGGPLPHYDASAQFTESLSDFEAASWDEILVGASARYRVTFANDQWAWLANIQSRPTQTQSERQEFASSRSPALGPSNNNALRIEKATIELAALTKDLTETLGKVPEIFADPLAAAARAASIERGVPEVFTWWVFQEWHSGKFPTVDGAFKRCGLGPQLKQTGLAFSRASVGRWLKIIGDEMDKRQLRQKRSSERGSSKARNFDVAQAADAGPRPGDADEPLETFVNWVGDPDTGGAMPTEEDVLAYVRARVGDFGLTSCTEEKLRKIASRWLKAAVKILNSVPTDRLETNEEDSLL